MRLLPHACYRGCVVHLGGADESSFFGKGTSDEPRANGQGVRRPEEEPGLQERLGGWPFRADAVVPRELEPGGMGLSPGEAVLLSGAPRGAADPRDAGAPGLCLIQGCGSSLGAIHRGAWKGNSANFSSRARAAGRFSGARLEKRTKRTHTKPTARRARCPAKARR